MKKSSYWKRRYGYLCTVMLALITFCFAACKDDAEQGGEAFDPDKPIVITDFMPKEGGFGSNLILYGDNFGNNPAKLNLTVGGQKARIISVKNKILYCVVPQRAYDGDIQISVSDDRGKEIAYAAAEKDFKYIKQWLVTTFIGQRFENSNDAFEREGTFDACGSVRAPIWFSFDPKSNFDHLYLTAYETVGNTDYGYFRLIDLAAGNVKFIGHIKNSERPAIVNWTIDENKDMVITRDLKVDGNVNMLYSRTSNFTKATELSDGKKKYKSATGAFVHPKNGDIYFTEYYTQDITRYSLSTNTYAAAAKHVTTKETTRMVVHPTGKYAYLMRLYYTGNNSGYIARMDYNSDADTFSEPYIVAGSNKSSGYADGVGNKALMQGPSQGVFVKNPAYEGEEDEYDFYFCDDYNHCVRILTPNGRVSTFAGRGNGNAEGGYADGELRAAARFNRPWALAYDEKRKCFYVGDRNNRLIRKIAQEE